MLVTPIQTDVVRPRTVSLHDLIDSFVADMPERSILAVSSKIVSLCEGRVVPIGSVDRDELIEQEAAYYLPPEFSRFGHHFTIAGGTIIGSAGIDQSNGDGNFVLWPEDAQTTANAMRAYLCERFGIRYAGVVITDSASQPLRLGAAGVALAYSGFRGLRNYIGETDLFDHPYAVTRSNIAAGLAAAAVVTMGEGNERTPFCLIGDVPFVEFQDADPTPEELEADSVRLADDLFAPFLLSAPWQRGRRPE